MPVISRQHWKHFTSSLLRIIIISQASQRGLCAGDQIVRVNGFCIDQCILAEVLQLIKLKPQLVLKVGHVRVLRSVMFHFVVYIDDKTNDTE